MQDNIITLNPRSEAKIDISALESFTDLTEWYAIVGNVLQELIMDVGRETLEEIGLTNVDFTLSDISQLQEAFACSEKCSPVMHLIGRDGNYMYVLTITAEFDEDAAEDEDDIDIPCTASSYLIRYGNAGDVCTFDNDTKKWVKLNSDESHTVTEKQMSMIMEGDARNELKTDILLLHAAEFGGMSDEDFDKLMKNNSRILALAESIRDFTEVEFADRDGTRLAVEMYNHDGARVIFKGGYYVLQAFYEGRVLQDVYRTKELEKMELIVSRIFNRACKDNVIAIVPLSDSAYSIFKEEGIVSTYFLYPRNDELTQAESDLVKKSTELIFGGSFDTDYTHI